MTDQETAVLHPIIRRKFRAALDLRESSIEQVARQAGVTTRHVQFVINGVRRPSPGLAVKLRAAVGESGWAFSTGQTDILSDDRPAGEVAAHAAA